MIQRYRPTISKALLTGNIHSFFAVYSLSPNNVSINGSDRERQKQSHWCSHLAEAQRAAP